MRAEPADLETFYASRQGHLVRRLISHHLRSAWPELAGQRVLGLGFPLPYLASLAENAERVIGLLPAQNRMIRPGSFPSGRFALADEQCLPLGDGAIDRVVLVHALEGCEQVKPMLREVWRVLADGGRMLIVVPNRRGLWTLSDTTPFGHGRPYSQGQIERTLRRALFEPIEVKRALFMPPFKNGPLLRFGVACERFGMRWLPHFGGVLLAEAEKSIYAGSLAPEAEKSLLPKYLTVPRRMAAARDRMPEPARAPSAARSAVIHEFKPRVRSS